MGVRHDGLLRRRARGGTRRGSDDRSEAISTHRVALLAWGLAALATTLLVSGFVAYLADAFELAGLDLLTTAITISFSAVGALIATRHPDNAIGWIFLGVAVFTGLGGVAHGYAQYRLEGGGTSALVETAAVYAEVSWVPFVLVPPSFLILLFPDGHLPSPRWSSWRGRPRSGSRVYW